MKIHSLSADNSIFYVGVNDRTTSLFESLWPLPSGVSYNSYLIDGGEKLAVVDGVELSHLGELAAHISRIKGDRQPDYLIINHMEPDHSGAIAMLRSLYPDITLVGNSQTMGMVIGFYGPQPKALTVKDGDTLSLGPGCTLRFAMTPMVHWPETMMTYAVEQRTLFSGDAFGCFGALNGAVIDSDMDTAPYYPEMVRYYTNIVGKYGMFVQRAMKKLASLNIGTICSTHGPVWRAEKAKVIALYDTLSRYEPIDDGVTIIYGSMYGNTLRMVEAVAEELAAQGVRRISVHNAATSPLSNIIADAFRHKGLVIAAPTYSDGLFPPVAQAVKALELRNLTNRPTLFLGGCTWQQKAVAAMEEILYPAPSVTFKHAPSASDIDAACSAARELAARLKE